MKPNINVFWFKRDLRLIDNQALIEAVNSKTSLLLLYLFEPKLIDDNHTSKRHINFIKESISDLNKSLKKFDTHIHVYKCELTNFFQRLLKNYNVESVFSTEETGLDYTFQRDKNFKVFCKENNIDWKFLVETSEAFEKVIVDPGFEYPDVNPRNNYWYKSE